MLIEHFPRWMTASIWKYFSENKKTVAIYFEGTERPREKGDLFELRINGPDAQQLTKTEWKFLLEVNLSYTVLRNDKDAHYVQRMQGIALTLFPYCIKVNKYGNGPSDDSSFLGVLVRKEDQKSPLQVSNFGQVDPNVIASQGTIKSLYEMYYCDD